MPYRGVPDDGMPLGVRWALAIGLTVIGGLSWFVFGWGHSLWFVSGRPPGGYRASRDLSGGGMAVA